jgi:hypothetical protein
MPVTYEQYSDADIVACQSDVPIRPNVRYSSSKWIIGAAIRAAVLAVALAGLVWWRRRERRGDVASAYAAPAGLTPFSLIQLLKRMHADARLSWSDRERATLSQTICDLEDRYFARGEAPAESGELATVLNRWLPRTRGVVATNGRA